MKVAAILTGKHNSTFKGKNYSKIKNLPVCLYPAMSALNCKLIQSFYVSSDSKIILNLLSKKGFKKIIRPKKLSQPQSLHMDVLIHSLDYLKKRKKMPEIIVVLLANSPTIKTSWIRKCIQKIRKNKKLTAVVPVIKNNDNHPFRAKKIKNQILVPFFNYKNKISSNRQDIPNSYFLAHNFWVIRSKEIYLNKGFPPWSFMGKNVSPFIIETSIDIHAKEDIKNCEDWLNKNSVLD